MKACAPCSSWYQPHAGGAGVHVTPDCQLQRIIWRLWMKNKLQFSSSHLSKTHCLCIISETPFKSRLFSSPIRHQFKKWHTMHRCVYYASFCCWHQGHQILGNLQLGRSSHHAWSEGQSILFSIPALALYNETVSCVLIKVKITFTLEDTLVPKCQNKKA
jgi:hypothetical protein